MAMLRGLGLRKLLSDHMPFLVRHKKLSFIGYNMLCQMAFHPELGYFNNGFICPSEIINLYINRFFHQAAKLNETAKAENAAFICLHECPYSEELRQKFVAALKDKDELQHYDIQFYNNDTASHYLITLVDTRRYEINTALTQAVSALMLNEGLKNRILPLVCTAKKTGEKILVVNVHAHFAKDVQQDIKDLCRHAAELGIVEVIFLGDFNRDLLLESDNYSKHDVVKALDTKGLFDGRLHVGALPGGTVCTKYNKETEQKSQGIETRDGAIASFPIEITCLTEMNTPDRAMLYHTPISKYLTFIPKEILERFPIAADVAVSSVKKAASY